MWLKVFDLCCRAEKGFFSSQGSDYLFCFIYIYFILSLLTLTLLLQLHNSTSRRELCSIIIFLDRWQGWALGKDPAEGKVARSGENTFVSTVRKKEWGGFSGREVESKWNQKSGSGDNGPNCAQRRVGDGQGRMEALTGYWSTNKEKKNLFLSNNSSSCFIPKDYKPISGHLCQSSAVILTNSCLTFCNSISLPK